MFMFDFMETIFPIFFIIVFVIVIGTFISDVLLAWLDPRARKEYLKG